MIASLISIIIVTSLFAIGDRLIAWAEAVQAGFGG